VFSERPLLFFLLEFKKTVPFVARNFKAILAHRRSGRFTSVIFQKPLRAELSRILEGSYFKDDVDGLSVGSKDRCRIDGLKSWILGVPPLPSETIPLHVIAFRHLDPGKNCLRNSPSLLVEGRALGGINFCRRLFFGSYEISGIRAPPTASHRAHNCHQAGKQPSTLDLCGGHHLVHLISLPTPFIQHLFVIVRKPSMVG